MTHKVMTHIKNTKLCSPANKKKLLFSNHESWALTKKNIQRPNENKIYFTWETQEPLPHIHARQSNINNENKKYILIKSFQ